MEEQLAAEAEAVGVLCVVAAGLAATGGLGAWLAAAWLADTGGPTWVHDNAATNAGSDQILFMWAL